ncbi:MAG: hypothetical protein HFI07_15805 [Lachnospiraceae bacterium]|nr:hypothetical protein [Lachnospiraceae bacterium]
MEYNVVMQILRYMIYIWEDFEKEMTKKHPGISSRKDFRYPPILPIVYYEGTGKWTAPMDISERILCGELLGKYLPHFQYQLLCLHDYSNEVLLEKRDEISLAMLINKIQCPEDLSAFISIPGEQVSEILKDTPEYLLDTMAKVLRALLYNMNLPESETEGVVSRIKERKMARLFENVKMDIQAERRKAAEAERKLEMVRSEAQRKAEEAQREVEEAQREVEEAQREVAEARQELERVRGEETRGFEICRYIVRMIRKNCAESEIVESMMQEFSLNREQAEDEYRKIMKE